MGNSTIILGTGRSGTTALYELLRHLLEFSHPGRTRYCYEPFLWDYRRLPAGADEMEQRFGTTEYLSAEGIYHHKTLPLLSDSDTSLAEASKAFLRSLTHCEAEEHLLTKFIRANGRYPLLRKVAPDAKFLVIVRNPIDLVNSIAGMFSLYGEEFHSSDYQRFVAEVEARHPDEAARYPRDTEVQRQAFCWLFTNLHCLQAAASDDLALCIPYELYRHQRESTLALMSDFLELPLPDDVQAAARRSVGWVTSDAVITREEVEELGPYLTAYREKLLPLMGYGDLAFNTISGADRLPEVRRFRSAFVGSSPLHLIDRAAAHSRGRRDLEAAYGKLGELRQRLADTQAALAQACGEREEQRQQLKAAEQLRDELSSAQQRTELILADQARLEKQFEDACQELTAVREARGRASELTTALQAEAAALEQSLSSLNRSHRAVLAELVTLHEKICAVRSIPVRRAPLAKFRSYRELVHMGREGLDGGSD